MDGQIILQLPGAERSAHPATAFVQVQVGAIRRGQELRVETGDGRLIGTISPFGLRAGAEAGTYSLPVPPGAIRDGKLTVRLTLTDPPAPPRAPTVEEVRDVRLLRGGQP